MVAWYPLDEQTGATAVADIAPPPGSTVSDTGVPKPAPVGPVGTGPTPVAGKVGAGALYFYGPFVEVPHSADLTFPGDFSIDAWIRVVPCGGGILAPIVDKWDPATQTGFSLFVDQPSPSTGFLKFQLNNLLFTSLTSLPTGANPLANTGPWVHVAVTVNRATGIGTFYINGAQAGSFALPTGSITNTLPMLIGGIRVPGGRCEIAIDELELFTRALDQQEIQGIVAADSAGKCRPQPIERGQICVLKFEDLDGDGVQDANEPLLPGWQFTVTDANNNPVGTITTSPPGTPLACLPVTAPGTYTVTEQVQSGWMPTTPTSQTVTVQPGQTVNVAFGNKRPCDLQISKRFSPNPAPTGQPVTITLTITNVGAGTCPPGPFPGTVVSEPVFPGMPFNLPVTISQSGGNLNWQCGFTAPGDYLNCATTDPLPPGYSATFTFTATITLTPGSQIRNCATVTNQSDINSQNNVSCATLLITGCVRPPANMTAWWPLDETSGTTANDLALVANNGTHVNGPTPTPGIVAGALRFDGVNDHVRVPDHPELNVGTGNFTLDAWVRTTASQGVVVLVDKRSGPTPLGYSLFLSNGRLGLQMANGTGSSTCTPAPAAGVSCVNYVAPTTSPNVADGQWHHVAAVVDRADTSSGVRLYVDGVQVFTGAPLGAPPSGSPATPANLDNTGDLYLGVRTPAQGIGLFFPGELDEVELIKRALTLQEIQALVQARSEGKCKACIEGMKWNDANGDGVINPGETGLSGWTIQLSGPVSGTTTTATGGTYRFCGLFPGTYTVSEALQPGWVQTFPPAPGTYTLTLVSAQIAANRNFGNRRVSGLPDLIVRNLRVVPLTIPRGGVAVASFDIVNQGEGQAGSATHQVRLFIRRPGAADVDVLLGTVSTGTLAAGASQSFNVPIRIPTDVPTGAATIRAIADSGSAVTEANEGNNVAEVQITITGGP
ncbi:MAG: LamG domain-containing protein [Blastocatellia bacterium]|nr:LamG domain-containing protein [Blastocatellia bacterium]